MTGAPGYFEAIRQKAAGRWTQLEADAELAGPWHQLFKQVQSPRHILSELLQNADDAGATEAAVLVEDGVFLFEHNGEDFTEEHFASLCRFGYSNKRALHTIGFRGIGFKSTFSLGDCVELFTPSLSVAFERRRFTQPSWIAPNHTRDGRTRIRVVISDSFRQQEVERNLADWRESPVSLLFFKHIRRLRIGAHDLNWDVVGPGPVAGSVRMALSGNAEQSYLLLTSKAESFPDDALAEIRQERMIDTEEQGAFPPCNVQVVLGATGRLYVVLPTGVATALPFACNAPFVQDPARLKIKDPETSPTNRWLLERCGALAAGAMLGWLGESSSPDGERALAYGLLPDVDRDASSLEGVCAAIVEESFADAIADCAVLLSEAGDLRRSKECVVIPQTIHDVWSPTAVAARFNKMGRPSLSAHVAVSDRRKLRNWGMVDEIDKATILAALKEHQLPRPSSWTQMLLLWAYIAPEITGYRYFPGVEKLNVVPVSRGDTLLSASEAVRLGDSNLLKSEGDWEFICDLVTVVHPDWLAYLAHQRSAIQVDAKLPGAEALAAAEAVLAKFGLSSPSDLTKVFGQVASAFFAPGTKTINDCVRVAQIAAKLSANVASSFRYVTQDCKIRPTSQSLYFDADGLLETLLPESRSESQILHSDYVGKFASCSREEWSTWVGSGLSGLRTAPKIVGTDKVTTTSSGFLRALKEISPHSRQPAFPYTSNRSYPYQRYTLRDFDFEADAVALWHSFPSEENVWGQIVERLCHSPSAAWRGTMLLQGQQTSTNGQSTLPVEIGAVPSAWIRRLRALPCLPDAHGYYRRPDELLRRTPETEALMGVEPFLDHRLDRAAIYPLLDALGVQSTASGPERLLDALRALAKTATPPVSEVDKWYRRLDQFFETCSTSDGQSIKSALSAERLIFSHDGEWTTAGGAYLSAGEDDLPDLALIRPTVADLSLWRRVGVAERPTVDLAIEWLANLTPGFAPTGADLRRVRSLLVRYPIRIWSECGFWLNLQGEWVPTSGLKYALTMQSLVPWGHLFPWVKQQTADLQRLSSEVTRDDTFAQLSLLAACIEERLENRSLFEAPHETREWLRTVGIELLRIELESAEETQRVRDLAIQLATTKWIESRGLEIVPYIDGIPAGTSRAADVVWIDQQLFVEPLSRAKLAKRVPDEIAKPFARQDIRSALDYCFERSVDDVREYLRENFSLACVEQADTALATEAMPSRDAGSDAAVHEPGGFVHLADLVSTDAEREGAGDSPTLDTEVPELAPERQPESPSSAIQEDRRASQPRSTPTADRPSLIERFAALRGFRKNGGGSFTHANGDRLARETESVFPWEHRASDGTLIRGYYAKEHCLNRAPLELETEVWGLLEKSPTLYSMVLVDIDSSPIEMTGVELRSMRDAKRITLYPAAYRLVLEQNNDA
ncbi:MAG: sacsin N-terminal ATP-binding-like domain-containing protein [Gemmatimonadaceae bacterium]